MAFHGASCRVSLNSSHDIGSVQRAWKHEFGFLKAVYQVSTVLIISWRWEN